MKHRNDRVAAYHADGYFVVPAFLATSELRELRHACDIALAGARARCTETGHTTHRISLFSEPSYFAEEPSALDRLALFAGSASVCALLTDLAFEHADHVPRLKTIDYYHEQTKHDWDGDWHRDIQFGASDLEHERRRLRGAPSVHLRVALESDDRLEIVPGSHARWDTPEELRIRKGSNRGSATMPGARRIALRQGDACVFHAASIHRATYRRSPLRRTLDLVFV